MFTPFVLSISCVDDPICSNKSCSRITALTKRFKKKDKILYDFEDWEAQSLVNLVPNSKLSSGLMFQVYIAGRLVLIC
jgi:hypothetical protein